MINLLVMVISCKKNASLWNKILKRNVENTIIVCGDKLTSDYYLNDKILYVNCHDGYGGLPEKVVCALTAIVNIKKYDNITHVMKIDDQDTIFSKTNITRLEKYGVSFCQIIAFFVNIYTKTVPVRII